jgi:hypothetical protein
MSEPTRGHPKMLSTAVICFILFLVVVFLWVMMTP